MARSLYFSCAGRNRKMLCLPRGEGIRKLISQLNKMNLTYRFLYLICFLFLLGFAGCATKQPSLYDTNPGLLTKKYTPNEIKAVEQGFKDNPSQYSQQLGSLLLWQIHQKSPQFALEFAQTPELNDGINPQEARAMISIYNLIKDLDIPPNLFKKITQYESDICKIIIEWQGNNPKKSDWSGCFANIGNKFPYDAKVLNAVPIEFEPDEDSIYYKGLEEFAELSWQSKANYNDTDGMIVTLRHPLYRKVTLFINNATLSFNFEDFLSKNNELVFDEGNGLEGRVIIKNASKLNIVSEFHAVPKLHAIREMVLSGDGDYRYSSLLQALLWGYMDGKFKEGDNPFKNYRGPVEFVKPIWGDMEGPRWEHFGVVTDRLNAPELIDYYEKKRFTYVYWQTIPGYSSREGGNPYWVFKNNKGDCLYTTCFTVYCLKKGGYKAWEKHVRSLNPAHDFHAISIFYWNGKKYVMDNGTPHQAGLMTWGDYKEAYPYRF